eukprot:g132.t1
MHFPSVGIVIKKQGEDLIEIQPFGATHERLQTLSLNLRSCLIDSKTTLPFVRECRVVPGLLGVIKLTNSLAVILIKEVIQVAFVHGSPIFKITQTEILTPSAISEQDRNYVSLVRKAVDPDQFGRGLYFSYGLLITQSTERMTGAFRFTADRVDASWRLEDDRFFWNAHLLSPVIQLKLHELILPVIQGFVSQLKEQELPHGTGKEYADFTLIARRSVRRLGTRNWRRGADHEGSVANFVETEQLLSLSSNQLCSFVQVRGSVPVFWTSIPNVKYKAPTKLSSKADYHHAFNNHISDLLQHYKECIGVNLAHATGSEGKLTRAFDEETRRFSRMRNGFRLVNFDFHKECGTTRYHKLNSLIDRLNDDFHRFSQFRTNEHRVCSVQGGVIRTNCVDCLDRTNVVQGVLGKKAIESFLREVDLIRQDQSFQDAFPVLERRLKILWADHGDEISQQYAGTGALKSGFTRTGKRSLTGLLDDGVKSITRYYLNNFEDGEKQDALDLVSGAFEVGVHQPRANLQSKPDLLLYAMTLLLLLTIAKLVDGLWTGSPYQACGCLALLILIGKFLIIPNGPSLTCKPCLRPDLTKQW